jgi:hypothetical protein
MIPNPQPTVKRKFTSLTSEEEPNARLKDQTTPQYGKRQLTNNKSKSRHMAITHRVPGRLELKQSVTYAFCSASLLVAADRVCGVRNR